jgi:hypothetical protein
MTSDGSFGEISASAFAVGDIVEWSKWNHEKDDWDMNYGIITSVTNEIKSNRLVSISKVLPLNDTANEMEFFTLSLRLVSPSEREFSSDEIKN